MSDMMELQELVDRAKDSLFRVHGEAIDQLYVKSLRIKELKADLDTANKAIGGLREEVGSLEADTACKSETILTANKRIAYLGKCNDYYEGNRSTHPSKEQTDK